MLQYYIDATSIPVELLILSGGITVTGQSPYVEIRDKLSNQYFDFNSRTFTATTVSSTCPLPSATDGLYRETWDVSGLFTTHTYLLFEYHDNTSMAIDDVIFVRPNISTGDANAGGFGGVNIEGMWQSEEKKRLFDKLKDIDNELVSFRRKALILLRDILDKDRITKEDIDTIKFIETRDNKMWAEFKKVLELNSDATSKEVISKLKEYIESEEKAKAEVLEMLRGKITHLDDDDYDDEEDD